MKAQYFIPLLLLTACFSIAAQTTNTPPKTKDINYTLDICGKKKIQNPKEAEIRQAVFSLDKNKGDSFLILGPTNTSMSYIQAWGDSKSGFDLEYQESDLKHHYEAKRSLTADEIVKAFTSYSTGADDWKKSIEWKPSKI